MIEPTEKLLIELEPHYLKMLDYLAKQAGFSTRSMYIRNLIRMEWGRLFYKPKIKEKQIDDLDFRDTSK